MALRIDGEGDNDGVGIRLVGRDEGNVPGMVLSAALDAGCRSPFVDLAFSPDGRYLAATFDCNAGWGQEGSALVLWSTETGAISHRIPTRHDWGKMLWTDQATLMLTRYDAQTRRAGLFRVSLQD